MTHKPGIITENKERKNMHPERRGNTSRYGCHAIGIRKETKVQELMFRDTMHVEHQIYDYNGNNWSNRNSNQRFTEKF